jgi:hypothetical protein
MPTMVRRLILLTIYNVQITRADDMVFTTELRALALQFGFKTTKRYSQIKNAINIAVEQVLRLWYSLFS